MSNLQEEYPALAADAVTNPDSARLLALLATVERALGKHDATAPRFEMATTPTE